jgi:ATP-dependent helicase/nuclease subunit B
VSDDGRQGDLFAGRPAAKPARGPNVYTLPPAAPFVDRLAAGLCRTYPGVALSRVLVLLPTRRAVRSLRDAFLRATAGEPLLLPAMRPIGDVDEDEFALAEPDPEALAIPPAIPALTRQLLLARLVERWGGSGPATSLAHAAELAASLASFIDQVHTERLDFATLKSLVPGDYAQHWSRTVDFLSIVTEHWPNILRERGALDPADRRNRLLGRQAARWRAAPPVHPIVAAGSTGTVPATADLLDVVARLPHGAVILPGLDTGLDEATWRALDHGHPQYAMKRLLERLQVGRDEIVTWSAAGDEGPPLRFAFLREALRPAAMTDAWRHATWDPARVTDGLTRIVCPGPREEAAAIALILREALETPEQVAALVTPDRNIARRVAAELGRWGIAIDDTAGVPLGNTPPGTFLRLTAHMVASGFAPIELLSALKHPFAAAGLAPGAFRRQVRRLERKALRGRRPGEGLKGIAEALERRKEPPAKLIDWLNGLKELFAPLTVAFARPRLGFAELLRTHVEVAVALATSDAERGADRLWRGDDGEALSVFVDEAAEAAPAFQAIEPSDYPELLDRLLAMRPVRPSYGRHPRLAIWGPLEARLQAADVVVLAGLNDGTWPQHPEVDPWLSRPMRARFGLPPPERRLGLSAHDFVQAACSPTVFLTRSAKVDGTPSVPSRWWLRIETLIGEPTGEERERALRYREWAEAIDRPRSPVEPIAAPNFAPPLAARPRRLSVTDIARLVRNPYEIYARHILKLRKLDPIDEPLSARDRGLIVHDALDRFVKETIAGLPADSLDRLLAIGRGAFDRVLSDAAMRTFWWPWFERAAHWLVTQERARRQGARPLASEIDGQLEFAAPGGTFTMRAKADRIERLASGGLAIIDYKTGALPGLGEVVTGVEPQLALEALIATAGGFPGIAPAAVEELHHWKIGGPGGGEERSVKSVSRVLDEADAGLRRLIAAFDDPVQAYLAVPRPRLAPRYDDYEHLARVKEWTTPGKPDQ